MCVRGCVRVCMAVFGGRCELGAIVCIPACTRVLCVQVCSSCLCLPNACCVVLHQHLSSHLILKGVYAFVCLRYVKLSHFSSPF